MTRTAGLPAVEAELTTEGGLDKVNEALAAGANEYLKKPFTPDQLAEKIGGFLS